MAMDTLVQLVQEKTGLSEEHSRDAVEVVIAYVKTKLPDSIEPLVDQAIDDEQDDPADDEGLVGKLSSLF